MGRHQHNADAVPLWDHFQTVIDWIERVFALVRPNIMKGVDWGPLYDDHKEGLHDSVAIGEEVARLIADDEVQKQAGIYPYVLTRDERYLNLRAFPKDVKQRVHEKQNGECAQCGEAFDLSKMEAAISPLGQRAARPLRRTARCYAKSTIDGRLHDDTQPVVGQSLIVRRTFKGRYPSSLSSPSHRHVSPSTIRRNASTSA